MREYAADTSRVEPTLPALSKPLEWLYNANEAPATVQVVAGHYGQHRFQSVTEGSISTVLNAPRVYLVLPASAEAKLAFELDRFLLPPSLEPATP
jgi:hypothetical protein